jgi:hypothetical protein
MAENFVGKWKLIDSKNFDDYMKQIGIGFITRKAVGVVKRMSTIYYMKLTYKN